MSPRARSQAWLYPKPYHQASASITGTSQQLEGQGVRLPLKCLPFSRALRGPISVNRAHCFWIHTIPQWKPLTTTCWQTGLFSWLFREKYVSSSSHHSHFLKVPESWRLLGDEGGDLIAAQEMGLHITKAANASLKTLSLRARNKAVGTTDISFLFISPSVRWTGCTFCRQHAAVEKREKFRVIHSGVTGISNPLPGAVYL